MFYIGKSLDMVLHNRVANKRLEYQKEQIKLLHKCIERLAVT